MLGLSTGTHTEFKQSAVFGTDLPPPEVLMKDMRVQYQTSLGLGAPFPKDSVPRTGRREAVFEVGISCAPRRRLAASMLRTPWTLGAPLFNLLLEGGAWLTLAPCTIRVYVLLTRMEVVTEDVPVGLGIVTSLGERRRVFSWGVTFSIFVRWLWSHPCINIPYSRRGIKF